MNYRLALLLAALPLLCTCSRDASEGPSDAVPPWTSEPVIAAPWLRMQPPDGMIAYFRIPHPLALLASPKGNLLDPMLGSEANVRNVIAIRDGLAQNLGSIEAGLDDPRLIALIAELRSPVEVAIRLVPAPTFLVGATFETASGAGFETLLAELGQREPRFGLAAPLDDRGYGEIVGLPFPVFVRFEDTSGRVAILGGPAATLAELTSELSAPETTMHPMHALERQIDSSGQGFFAWFDTARALRLGAGSLVPGAQSLIAGTGAASIESVAAGAGIADGKGRLKLVVDVGEGVEDRPVPLVANSLGARSSGEPRMIALLSLPSPEEYARLEARIFAAAGPQFAANWQRTKRLMADSVGIGIEDLLRAVGPEIVSISDRAGDYVAVHVRDTEMLESMLERMVETTGAVLDQRQVSGRNVRYLRFARPRIDADAADSVPAVARVVSRIDTRVYWIDEGEYLYLSGIPQTLISRTRQGADDSIAAWLNDTQHFDVSASLLAFTGSLDRVPRLTYQAYLGTMQALADIAGVDFDVWSMPTADDLRLPDKSAFGFKVDLGEPYLSLEFSYESQPAEIFFGSGSLPAIAAVGIIAAIAIPAYQDYTIRAQVAEGLNLAARPRGAVAAYYESSGGRVPADRVEAGLSANPADSSGRFVAAVDIVDGSVVITYGNLANATLAGQTLVLAPYEQDGAPPVAAALVWACGAGAVQGAVSPAGTAAGSPRAELGFGSLADPQFIAYLPSACR